MKIFNRVLVGALTAIFAFSAAGLIKAATTVSLNTSDNFAVIGASTVTNTGATVINGGLALSPGTSVTGFPPATLNGAQSVSNASAIQAQSDVTTAYNAAASQPCTQNLTGQDLGGLTLTPGVYCFDNSAQLTGTLTLDGQADPNAVFIFKTGSTLTTATNSSVVFINAAQACNVFWQVGSSATLGVGTSFKGNILALTSATLNTGANVEGRVFARNGAVTLDTNTITRATCVISPTPTTTPVVGTSSTPPLISIKKVPTPLSLSASGSVAYNYTVTNPGTVAISNISVVDNKCSPVNFVSGDTNGNSKLDVNETWKYNCATTISQTTTNTATATGMANGLTAVDTANATVAVGTQLPPPLINLVKKSSALTVSYGAPVRYTYTVTNPGTVALKNVSLVDNKCSPITKLSGDTNNNNMLDASETWTYACQANLTSNTTNTATAEGSANGLTAMDTSVATVMVTSPTLPNTGIGDGGTPWYVIAAGLILAITASVYLFLKIRTV